MDKWSWGRDGPKASLLNLLYSCKLSSEDGGWMNAFRKMVSGLQMSASWSS